MTLYFLGEKLILKGDQYTNIYCIYYLAVSKVENVIFYL